MKKQREDHFEELQKAYNRYFDLPKNGGSDPFHPDGQGMNLCANHFYYHKEKIKENCPQRSWPCLDWMYENVLVEMPSGYMARKDEIRAAAVKALAAFESDTNLLRIRQSIGLLSREDKKSTSADYILCYYTRLWLAIEEGDYVAMRCYENHKTYFESFERCALAIKELDLGLFG
jgi:hypothetical protein